MAARPSLKEVLAGLQAEAQRLGREAEGLLDRSEKAEEAGLLQARTTWDPVRLDG